MARHLVCPVEELPPGARKIIEAEGRSIGVFNVDGRYYALRNRCPHQGAPLCLGQLKALVLGPRPYEFAFTRDGEILRCPWHGWEFDVTTGRSVVNPHRLRVKRYETLVGAIGPDDEDPRIETYPVSIEREAVFVEV